MTTTKAKDDNARAQERNLSNDPSADARPMPADTEVRKATVRLVTENVKAEDLPLPNDVHAEAQLLATLLWHGTNAPPSLTVSDVQDLLESEDRFFSPPHRVIFKAMLTVHSGMQVTSITLVHGRLVHWRSTREAGGIEYLEQLVASASPMSGQTLRAHATAIRDAWARRQMIALMADVGNEARRGKATSEAIVEKAHTGLVNIASLLSASSTYLSFAQVAADVLRNVGSGKTDALPTGLTELDEMTGGWYPQEVTIIAARTSVGKSALATQFAFDAVAQRPNEAVLYVSLEMPARQFVARILASRSGVSLRSIRRHRVTVEELKQLEAAEHAMQSTRVYFVDSQLQTIMSISAIASRLNAALIREGKRLSKIIVDHLGLVKPSPETARKPREQQVSENSRGLKYLAQHHRCHVMGLAQIGREAEKQQGKSKMPMLHHLRESGSIEQDAENILIIHREKDANGWFKKNTPAKLNVAKARNDGLGLIWLAFEERIGRFVPWAKSDQSKACARSGGDHPTTDGQGYERPLDPDEDD